MAREKKVYSRIVDLVDIFFDRTQKYARRPKDYGHIKDEVRIINGVSNYYLYGKLIAKFDDKTFELYGIDALGDCKIGNLLSHILSAYKFRYSSEKCGQLWAWSKGFYFNRCYEIEVPYPLVIEHKTREVIVSSAQVEWLIYRFIGARKYSSAASQTMEYLGVDTAGHALEDKVVSKRLKMALDSAAN